MKNFKYLIILVSFIAVFSSCDTEEEDLTDCYTCETSQAEYCYTIGQSYYVTTSKDGETSHTSLNGSWNETKVNLIAECYGLAQTQALVGNWIVTDFHGTSTTVINYNDPDINSTTSITTQNKISSDVILTLNEDHTYTATGSMEINSVTRVDGNVTNDSSYTSTPAENGQWSVIEDQFIIITDGVEHPSTIISQTENEFTLKTIIHKSQDYPSGNSTIDAEFFQTYTRQ